MRSFRNSNGLVNGMIPSNKQCPFWGNGCGMENENCPSHDNNNIRDWEYSCATARGISIVLETRVSVARKLPSEE